MPPRKKEKLWVIAVFKSILFVTLSVAKGLNSSVAMLPQNDRHEKLFLEATIKGRFSEQSSG